MLRSDDSGPAGALAVPVARPGLPALPLLIAVAFLVTVDVRMITPLLPTMAASLDTTVAAIGLAVTAYTLPYGFCQFVYGPLADRFGGIRVVRLAFCLFSGGSIGSAVLGPLVDHGWHRLFLAICGLSLLGLGAAATRLLDRSPHHTRE